MAIHIGRSRLPLLLYRSHMSQDQFADRLGVTQSYISKIVNGERIFSLIRAKAASEILRCQIEDLYEWEQ